MHESAGRNRTGSGCAEGVVPHPKRVSGEGRAPVLLLPSCTVPSPAAKAWAASDIKLMGEW